MNAALRKLANQPHGHIAGRAFCAYRSFVLTGLQSEADLEKRLASILSSTIDPAEAQTAIRQGFQAAKRR
jgi:hypothetical protein